MKRFMLTLATLSLSIVAHGGWETDGTRAPRKTVYSCLPADNTIDGVRYPTLVLDENTHQWNVTSGVIYPGAPIKYSPLQIVKVVVAEDKVVEYYQTEDQHTQVKIVKTANQEVISAQVKNSILYNCLL